MNIETICQMTKNPAALNALHACKGSHPWNRTVLFPYLNALCVASQRREISAAALAWLQEKAKEEQGDWGH